MILVPSTKEGTGLSVSAMGRGQQAGRFWWMVSLCFGDDGSVSRALLMAIAVFSLTRGHVRNHLCCSGDSDHPPDVPPHDSVPIKGSKTCFGISAAAILHFCVLQQEFETSLKWWMRW